MTTLLAAALARRIRAGGPITVAEYMAEALGHPKHGYYMTRDPFGAAGDFVTAPEISQMFGELVGLWAAEVWQSMGRPRPLRLVELGPGRGTLMADAWRAAGVAPDFRAALDIHLVETSPVLAAQQRTRLQDMPVAWHPRFDDVPEGPAIVVANEFFDALPVHMLECTAVGWRERMVTVGEADRLELRLAPTPTPATALAAALAPARIENAPVGAVLELPAAGFALMRAIAARLAEQGGAALLFDYGPAESGYGQSLQAVRGHRPCGPFDAPGETDLTVHVDFAGLAGAAGPAVRVFGPVAQGDFLGRLGIDLRRDALLARASPAQATTIRAAHHRLTAPDAMGRLFKAMAAAHPSLHILPGFAESA